MQENINRMMWVTLSQWGLNKMVWRVGIPPIIDGAEFKVQLEDSTERTCRRSQQLDRCNLFFTDCKHPMQNAYCPTNKIRAWELVDNDR